MSELVPRCIICHHALRDPLSMAIGIGPECRHGSNGHHKLTKRKMKILGNIQRAENFRRSEPLVFPQLTYRREEQGWTSDGKHFSSDDEFKKYLLDYNLMDGKVLEILETLEAVV